MLQDLLHSLLKYRWRFLAVFAVTFAFATVLTLRQDSIYRSTSTVLIEGGRENVYRSEVGNGESVFERDRDSIIKAEMRILTSRDLAEQLVRTIGPRNLYPKLEISSGNALLLEAAALEIFQEALEVTALEQSDLIEVRFEHSDPGHAYEALDTYLDLFKRKHLEVFGETELTSFLEDQVGNLRAELDTIEWELEQFKLEHGNFSLDSERGLLVDQRQNLDRQRKSAAARQASLERKAQSLAAQMSSLEEQVAVSTEVDQSVTRARERLLDLRVQESQLLGTFREDNRRVRNIREQIQIVEDFLATNDSTRTQLGRNSVFLELQNELIRTRSELQAETASLAVLDTQRTEVTTDLESLAQREAEFRDLTRRRESVERNLQNYTQRLDDNELSREMDARGLASIRIVEAPSLPLEPASPNRKLLLAASLVLATLLGAAAALLSGFLNPTIGTQQRLERQLAVPVLVAIDDKRAGEHS